MECRRFDELTGTEVYEILKARSAVFMMEQKIFYLDMDNIDYKSIHIFEQGTDGRVTVYLRLFPSEERPEAARIGRVLTMDRGLGNGRKLLCAAEEYALRNGYSEIVLDAQVQTVRFYQKCGYEVISKEFIEAGIPHVQMRKVLSDAAVMARNGETQ